MGQTPQVATARLFQPARQGRRKPLNWEFGAPRATLPAPVRRGAPAPPTNCRRLRRGLYLSVLPERPSRPRARRRSGVPAPGRRRSLKTQQHVRSGVPTGGFEIVSRFDCRSRATAELRNIPSDPRPARCTTPATQYGADNSLYRLVSTGHFGGRLTRQSFTESLILAQDERWRRA